MPGAANDVCSSNQVCACDHVVRGVVMPPSFSRRESPLPVKRVAAASCHLQVAPGRVRQLASHGRECLTYDSTNCRCSERVAVEERRRDDVKAELLGREAQLSEEQRAFLQAIANGRA